MARTGKGMRARGVAVVAGCVSLLLTALVGGAGAIPLQNMRGTWGLAYQLQPCSQNPENVTAKIAITKWKPSGSFSGFGNFAHHRSSSRVSGTETPETGNNGYPLLRMSAGPLGEMQGLAEGDGTAYFYPPIPCYPGHNTYPFERVGGAPACSAIPKLTGQAVRDPVTGNVDVKLTARDLGGVATCGRERLTATAADGSQVVARAHRQGQTATASARLVKAEVCEGDTQGLVRLSKSSARAERKIDIPDSVARIDPTSTRATRDAQGAVTVTAKIKHLLPLSHCQRPQVTFKDADGTDTLKVKQLTATKATATAHLPKNQECAVSGELTVVQKPTAHARRTVQVSGSPPSFCHIHSP